MRTITRREFNHQQAKIMDEVLATGEPVRVTSRDGRTVIVSPDVAQTRAAIHESWVRVGLIRSPELPSESLLNFEIPDLGPGVAERIISAMEEDH